MDVLKIISSYDNDNSLIGKKNIINTINTIYSTWFNKLLLGIEIFINLFLIINKYLCYYLLNNVLKSSNENIIIYFLLYSIGLVFINFQTNIINYNANLIYSNTQDQITKKITEIKYDHLKTIGSNRIMNFNLESYYCGYYMGKLLSIPLYLIEIIGILIYCMFTHKYYLLICLIIYISIEIYHIYINIFDDKFISMKNINNPLNAINHESYENIKYLKMKNLVSEQRNSSKFKSLNNIINKLNLVIFIKVAKNNFIKSIVQILINYLFIKERSSYFLYLQIFHSVFENISKYDDITELLTYLSYGISYSLFINLGPKYCENNLKSDLKNEKINIQSIEFKNLSKKYNDVKCFDKLNFKINKGDKIALLGKSGEGKSTLIDVLLGLTDYDGDILINDHNISLFNINQIRNSIGVISQKPDFFNMSLRDNLLLEIDRTNKNVSTISDCDIIDILQKVNLHFNNLDMIIDNQGSNFSGGQKQRLGIIRTLLSDKEIIILDEPTSALDEITEMKTINLINEMSKNKTIIYITHKEYVLKHVDYVVRLEQGKIKLA